MISTQRHRLVLLLAVNFVVWGCASTGGDGQVGTAHGEARSVVPSIDLAMNQLNIGNEAAARLLLEDYLRQNPKSASTKLLLAQIDGDPRSFLGNDFEPYTVRRGDTMSDLAARFAGDRLLFYALARHNRLASPQSLAAGAVIQVPRAAVAASETGGVAEAPAPAGASKTVVSKADRKEAERLRRVALNSLNAGNADQAVKLLGDAHRLAPDSETIKADLARAERIMKTVETRSR